MRKWSAAGRIIRDLRIAKKIFQKEIIAAVGLREEAHLRRYERGETKGTREFWIGLLVNGLRERDPLTINRVLEALNFARLEPAELRSFDLSCRVAFESLEVEPWLVEAFAPNVMRFAGRLRGDMHPEPALEFPYRSVRQSVPLSQYRMFCSVDRQAGTELPNELGPTARTSYKSGSILIPLSDAEHTFELEFVAEDLNGVCLAISRAILDVASKREGVERRFQLWWSQFTCSGRLVMEVDDDLRSDSRALGSATGSFSNAKSLPA